MHQDCAQKHNAAKHNAAAQTGSERLKAAATQYLQDATFSDLTIVCESTEWKVHRCFIVPHSKWFERCCKGAFQEGSSRRIELEEDNPLAVARMITYFYTFDYDDSLTSVEANTNKVYNELDMNAWVYVTADKYDVPELRTMALRKFMQAGKRL